jgi:hypothetical protein
MRSRPGVSGGGIVAVGGGARPPSGDVLARCGMVVASIAPSTARVRDTEPRYARNEPCFVGQPGVTATPAKSHCLLRWRSRLRSGHLAAGRRLGRRHPAIAPWLVASIGGRVVVARVRGRGATINHKLARPVCDRFVDDGLAVQITCEVAQDAGRRSTHKRRSGGRHVVHNRCQVRCDDGEVVVEGPQPSSFSKPPRTLTCWLSVAAGTERSRGCFSVRSASIVSPTRLTRRRGSAAARQPPEQPCQALIVPSRQPAPS